MIVPHHPGYGRSERPQWLRSVRDVAVVYQSLLAALDIDRQRLLAAADAVMAAMRWLAVNADPRMLVEQALAPLVAP